jgi:hypothetical protein
MSALGHERTLDSLIGASALVPIVDRDEWVARGPEGAG